jgi:hypothetical protein
MRVTVAEGEIRARVPEMVVVGVATARDRVAVDETTPREREIVAVAVAVAVVVGKMKFERVTVPLGEIASIDENSGVEDAETVPAPPP